MSKTEQNFTVKRGRYGFNGNALAAMNITDAKAAFKTVAPKLIEDVHAEAVKTKKKNDKAAKK